MLSVVLMCCQCAVSCGSVLSAMSVCCQLCPLCHCAVSSVTVLSTVAVWSAVSVLSAVAVYYLCKCAVRCVSVTVSCVSVLSFVVNVLSSVAVCSQLSVHYQLCQYVVSVAVSCVSVLSAVFFSAPAPILPLSLVTSKFNRPIRFPSLAMARLLGVSTHCH